MRAPLLLLLALSASPALAQTTDPAKTQPITTKALRLGGAITCAPGLVCDASPLSIVAPGATAPRTTAARSLDMGRNVRDFGAVCDGTTDNGPAFRAAAAVARVVRYDLEGCASNYLVNTSVTFPTGVSVVGPMEGLTAPLGIRTTANIDTFILGGDQYGITNTRIQHDGTSGMAINGKSASYGVIARNSITGTAASNPSPLVQIGGSLATIEQNNFTNARTTAYSLSLYSSGATPPIVERVLNNTFGGVGKGLSIGAATGSPRPEGVYLTTNHCFLSNVCLVITSVNDIRSTGNTWDLGATNQVVLAGSGQGIDLASFTDDYFSTLDNTVNPPVARPTGVCLAVSGAVSRVTVRSKFAYCGYGIASTDGNTSNLTVASNFLNVANIALNLQNVKGATLTGNTCTNCAFNFILADGASGGPFVLNENQWDPAGSISLTQTDATKFRFGSGNTGKVLAGSFAATSGSMAKGSTCGTVAIPHSMGAVPNLDKTTLTPRVVSGTMTNVTASLVSADTGNITAQVCANVTTTGKVRVTATSSL